MKEEFWAWAIDSRSPEGHGLIGRYWWFEGQPPQIPVGLRGCQIALFETRAVARQYLPDVKKPYSFPKARVIKVKVTVGATQ